MKHISVLLLSLVFFTSCHAQVNRSDRQPAADIQTKNTRTQGTNKYDNVHCALQDRAGNLWFGVTGNGVCRYDGHSFIHFTQKDGLCDNNVCSILEDKTGNIWFGTSAGLCRYDPSATSAGGSPAISTIPLFTANGGNIYSLSGKPSGGAPTSIWSMMQDRAGKIWLCTSNGVYCYDGKTYTRFLDNDGVANKNDLKLNRVAAILQDRKGNIWFATWFEGVCRYDGRSITNFKPNGEVWFDALLEDRAGSIWIGRRNNGVCRYDPPGTEGAETFTNVLQHGVFDSCCICAMAQDKAGNIWFGAEFGDISRRETMGGAWCYDGKTFKNLTLKDGLCNMSVFSVTIDNSGKLWFGARGLGLCCYNGKSFTDFSDSVSVH